jgi:hypothetical protein
MQGFKNKWRSLEPWQRAELVIAAFLAVEMVVVAWGGGYVFARMVCRG